MSKVLVFLIVLFSCLSTTKASTPPELNNINMTNLDKIEKEIKEQEKALESIEDYKIRISKNISIIEDKLLYMRQAIGQLNIEYKNY